MQAVTRQDVTCADDLTTAVLVPAVVDACRGKISRFTGLPIQVVAAGGIHDGRGLAAALM